MAGAAIGIYGLGVMGRNLALNFTGRGFAVAAHDPWPEACDRFEHAAPGLRAERSAEAFVAALGAPRTVLVMMKAGQPVDDAIAALLPLLAPGDAIMDGGNSFWRDTERRAAALAARGLDFLGVGVSGGEAGARTGPSIMVGGPARAWDRARPAVEAIAARHAGQPCCARLGEGGAGHFVKMIHNGIEYAEMQLLAEAYLLLQAAGLGYPEMADAFARWNAGPGASYLLEITAGILRRSDPETGRPMPEIVLDKAGQKGTGQWAAVAALELGVAAPTLVEAVAARALSAVKEERVAAAAVLSPLPSSDGEGRGEGARDGRTGMVEALGDALYAAKIAVYAQGFAVLAAASREQGWGLDLARTAEIWRAGCIIRSALLDPIARAFRQAPAPANLMLAFAGDLATRQETWRGTVGDAASSGVPVPALASALAYHDGYRRARGGANLIQCQRDWFGAHGYERVDRAGSFHTEWEAS